MAIGVVWLVVGLLWWGAILAGACAAFVSRPKGRRARFVAGYFAVVGGLVGSTALFPTVAVWVWLPIFFVLLIPVLELKALFGG